MRGVTLWQKSLNSTQTFQLTRLMRDVTEDEMSSYKDIEDFNSHASCEA